MYKIEINSLPYIVNGHLSVLEACKLLGLNIPRFCYHETLSIAGNCRMCLVELQNSPKPVASCALPLVNNMKIFLNTPLVQKARENVLESLLISHPLDCPICDQAGECDLQDQAKKFGVNFSRFFAAKRGVEDKKDDILIKTIMTRCIHCTRCVRFGIEVAGKEVFGTINRGKYTEISPYSKNTSQLLSYIAGNVIDLCPVGALTARPYAFKMRPWELTILESIDLTDGLGSNLYLHLKGGEISRILPKLSPDINENLISDRARFFFDSLNSQRISNVFIKTQQTFKKTEWKALLFQLTKSLIDKKKQIIIINNTLDLETVLLLKVLTYKYNKYLILKKDNSSLNHSNFNLIGLSDSLKTFNKDVTCFFLVSLNLQLENVILNHKVKKKTLKTKVSVYSFGQFYTNSTYATSFINTKLQDFLLILEGKNKIVSKLMVAALCPFFLIGESLYKKGFSVLRLKSILKELFPSSAILNVWLYANLEGLNYNFIEGVTHRDLKNYNTCLGINLDNTFFLYKELLKNKTKLFWFNSFGSKFSSLATYIIPVCTELEEENIYVNLEQRPQITIGTNNIISKEIKSLKEIILFLLNLTSFRLFNYSIINFFKTIIRFPGLFSKQKFFKRNLNLSESFLKSKIQTQILTKPSLTDFFLFSKFTKGSDTMGKASRAVQTYSTNFFN